MATIFRRGAPFSAGLGQSLGNLLGGALQGMGTGIEGRSSLQQLMQGLEGQGYDPQQAKSMAQLGQQAPGLLQNLFQQAGQQNLLAQQQAGQQQLAQQRYKTEIAKKLLSEGYDISSINALFERIPQQSQQAEPFTSDQVTAPSQPRNMQELQQQTNDLRENEPWKILQTKPIGKTQRAIRQQAYKEQINIDKGLKSYVDAVNVKGGSASKLYDNTLNRMLTLIDTGKLTGPTMYNIRKKLEEKGAAAGGGIGAAIGALAGSLLPGIGTFAGATAGGGAGSALGALVTPKFVGSTEDQEFQKLTLSFLDRLKDVFGGRISNIELQNFMDSIPTLSQTDEGKKAVIRDMGNISKGWKYKKKIMDRIISDHGGYMPRNLEKLTDEQSAPYLDKLSSEFVLGDAPRDAPLGGMIRPQGQPGQMGAPKPKRRLT